MAFLYGVMVQWKIDLRNKEILLTYYVVPLVFFAFMGIIFTSIMPETKSTLMQSMTIFGTTMGAIIGTPIPISQTYGSELKKAYQIGGVPIYIPLLNNLISAFIHLFIMSIIIYFTAPAAFGAEVPVNTAVYFTMLALFIITNLSISSVLGLMIKSTSKLTMVSQFIFLPSLMLSGIMFPVKMLPKYLANAGKVLPAVYGFEIMNKDNIEINLVFPLLIIILICTFISVLRINKIKTEY